MTSAIDIENHPAAAFGFYQEIRGARRGLAHISAPLSAVCLIRRISARGRADAVAAAATARGMDRCRCADPGQHPRASDMLLGAVRPRHYPAGAGLPGLRAVAAGAQDDPLIVYLFLPCGAKKITWRISLWLAVGLQLLHKAATIKADPFLLDLPAGQVKNKDLLGRRALAGRRLAIAPLLPASVTRATAFSGPATMSSIV